jgi:HEAT repeat protein
MSTWLLALGGKDLDKGNQALDALRAIGTNGLPVMIEMLQTRDSPLKTSFIQLVEKQRFVNIHVARDSQRRGAALRGFQIMGAQAAPAIASLSRLMEQPNTTRDAATALLYIGQPAIGEFCSALTNQLPFVRGSAAIGIGQLFASRSVWQGSAPPDRDPDPSKFVPLLLACCKDSDPDVRRYAETALAHVCIAAPNAVLRELQSALTDSDECVRRTAAERLSFLEEGRVGGTTK